MRVTGTDQRFVEVKMPSHCIIGPRMQGAQPGVRRRGEGRYMALLLCFRLRLLHFCERFQ